MNGGHRDGQKQCLEFGVQVLTSPRDALPGGPWASLGPGAACNPPPRSEADEQEALGTLSKGVPSDTRGSARPETHSRQRDTGTHPARQPPGLSGTPKGTRLPYPEPTRAPRTEKPAEVTQGVWPATAPVIRGTVTAVTGPSLGNLSHILRSTAAHSLGGSDTHPGFLSQINLLTPTLHSPTQPCPFWQHPHPLCPTGHVNASSHWGTPAPWREPWAGSLVGSPRNR